MSQVEFRFGEKKKKLMTPFDILDENAAINSLEKVYLGNKSCETLNKTFSNSLFLHQSAQNHKFEQINVTQGTWWRVQGFLLLAVIIIYCFVLTKRCACDGQGFKWALKF